ncbi:MAG: MATE family efflux transporter, partial [Hungatella sp.]
MRSVALFAILVSGLVLLYPENFMRIYSSDPVIIRLGASYLRIAAWMYLPCAVSTMLFACCRGIEQVRISFMTNAFSYPLNILLDYCFIFGKFGFPEMGIQGAAVGAVISRLAEFVILGYFVLVKEKRIQIKLKDLFRRDKKLNRDFLLVGLPIVAHELIWSTGTTAGSAITGQMGTAVVGGYNVANVLYQLVACFMNGSLHACTITIGKTIGSGAGKAEIKKQAYSVLLIGGFFGSILGIVTILACVP